MHKHRSFRVALITSITLSVILISGFTPVLAMTLHQASPEASSPQDLLFLLGFAGMIMIGIDWYFKRRSE